MRPTSPAPTPANWLRLVLFGALLWFAAAMIVRFGGPAGILAGGARLLTYALVIPGTVPFILAIPLAGGVGAAARPLATTVVTMAALLLDGVALAWFPGLYGDDPAVQFAGAAVIMWGAGVGLALGLLLPQPRASA